MRLKNIYHKILNRAVMSLNKGDDSTSKTKKKLNKNFEQTIVSNMSSSTELKSDSAEEEVVKQG